MVQSVEMLLAAHDERQVRSVWQRLLDAGLPSQGRNPSPSNRPHVTLVALPEILPDAEALLRDAVAGRLPAAARWGEVRSFGRSPSVLVRLVDPSEAVRALQAAVAQVCAVPGDHLMSPGHWTPHVTLARRVPDADLGRAVDVVSAAVEQEAPMGSPVTLTEVRRWDGSARRAWLVGRRRAKPDPCA